MSRVGLGKVTEGLGANISPSAKIVFRGTGELILGRYTQLGDNVKIVINDGNVKIDDWTTIHENSLVLGGAGVSIGRHCWFGQNTVLDGTGDLQIHDGVRVGMYSQIWSHVAAGEQIEGCVLFGTAPTIIEKDVWLVGSCTISSNVTIGARTICMNGSNVTKSLPQDVTAMGVPARVREGLSFYSEVSLDQKFDMLADWSSCYATTHKCEFERTGETLNLSKMQSKILVLKTKNLYNLLLENRPENTSLFCLETKSYSGLFNAHEEQFIRWLAGNKARFYPDN